METIKIALADDHSLFREGIRMIVSGMKGIEVVLEAPDGKELLEQLNNGSSVDVILLDIEMASFDGIETIKLLRERKPTPKVIVLSMHTEPRMVSYMMEQGANGYLPKDVKKEEFEKAIRSVVETGMYLSDLVSKSLLAHLSNKSKSHSPYVELTQREKEVLLLISNEFTAREIGEKLFISERTVEGHRKNLCQKLGVKNTAGLVKKAIQLNLLQ